MKLGDKIRELRKEQGMTQALLAGSRITPNMLCEIEKNTANPSMDTLRYLAHELSVPLSYLIDENEDLNACRKRAAMPEISRLYHAGKYNDCFRLCEQLPGEPDDETALLLASSALESGKRAFSSGNMETALVYCNEAVRYAQKTAYPTKALAAEACLYAAAAEKVNTPHSRFSNQEYLEKAGEAVGREFYAYLTDDATYPYRNEIFRLHQKARVEIRGKRFAEALPYLTEAEEKCRSAEADAYLLFRLFGDLELCYRESKDFEKAYAYASKRVDLLAAFQS